MGGLTSHHLPVASESSFGNASPNGVSVSCALASSTGKVLGRAIAPRAVAVALIASRLEIESEGRGCGLVMGGEVGSRQLAVGRGEEEVGSRQ